MDIFNAHPEQTANAVNLFTRGQETQAYCRRYYPLTSQETPERTEATFLMEQAVQAGVIDAVPTTPDLCANCGKPAAHCCAQCNVMHYCARECQIAHWKQQHRKECKKLQALRKQVKQGDKDYLTSLQLSAKPLHTKVSSGKKAGEKN